jgi:hypothetical protein
MLNVLFKVFFFVTGTRRFWYFTVQKWAVLLFPFHLERERVQNINALMHMAVKKLFTYFIPMLSFLLEF